MMSGERDHHCLAADESEFFFCRGWVESSQLQAGKLQSSKSLNLIEPNRGHMGTEAGGGRILRI